MHPAPTSLPVLRSRHEWVRALPCAVVICGIAFCAFLLSLTRPGVFYSGDAGAKFLLIEQFARGEFHADLRVPVASWVRELWSRGFYPFEPPFVYAVEDHYFATFPLPFLLLTAPAYAVLGWRGFYFWPVVGVFAVWGALWWLCRKLGFRPAWTAVALFALIFGSPFTIYAAMFWEHTLGVAFAFGGLALLAASSLRSSPVQGVLGGILLGVAVWFRSELVWLAAVTVTVIAVSPRLGVQLRGRLSFVVGLAAAALGLLVWNVAAYGTALGMHARQIVEGADLASRLREAAWVTPRLIANLTRHGPVVITAGAAAVFVAVSGRESLSARGQVRLWGVLGLAFVLGVGIVLPRLQTGADGGKQFGPRYLLVVFPVASVLLAAAAQAMWDRGRRAARGLLCVGVALSCGAGVWLNAVGGARDLAEDYPSRVAPILDAVREDTAETIVVSHQFVALELASAFNSKSFFLTKNRAAMQELASALFMRGQSRFLFAVFGGSFEGELPVSLAGHRTPVSLRITLRRCSTAFCLHDAVFVVHP